MSMRRLIVAAVAAILAAPVAAQPVELQKGDPVVVVMGSGTDIQPGTKLKGTVTRYNREGLGLRVAKRGTWWIKWGHIRSVNGVRISHATTAKPRGGDEETAAPPPPSRPSAETTSDAAFDAAPAAAVEEVAPAASAARGRAAESPKAEYGERYGWRESPEKRQYGGADSGERGSWHYFGAVDILGVGNGAKGAQALANDTCAAVIANDGASSCQSSVTVDGAVGFRLGVFRDIEQWQNVEAGLSLGYLSGGPDISGKLDVTTTPAGAGHLAASDNTFRALAEIKKAFPLNEDWTFNIGAGLGWALDRESFSCTDSGIMAGDCQSLGDSNNTTTWETWELSPGVQWRHIQVGLRYVGFSRGGNIPWNTLGGFVGAEF